MQQHTIGLQQIHDFRVCFPDEYTSKQLRVGQVKAIRSNRIGHWQIVLFTNPEIVLAMSRRGVHRSCTRFGGDMITKNHRYLLIVKRVMKALQLKGSAFACTQDLGVFQTNSIGNSLV